MTDTDKDSVADKSQPREGPLADRRPDADEADTRTGGAQPQEKVEDRDNVGSVKPEDYPEGQRASGDLA